MKAWWSTLPSLRTPLESVWTLDPCDCADDDLCLKSVLQLLLLLIRVPHHERGSFVCGSVCVTNCDLLMLFLLLCIRPRFSSHPNRRVRPTEMTVQV